jgi:hypothetical protein
VRREGDKFLAHYMWREGEKFIVFLVHDMRHRVQAADPKAGEVSEESDPQKTGPVGRGHRMLADLCSTGLCLANCWFTDISLSATCTGPFYLHAT